MDDGTGVVTVKFYNQSNKKELINQLRHDVHNDSTMMVLPINSYKCALCKIDPIDSVESRRPRNLKSVESARRRSDRVPAG